MSQRFGAGCSSAERFRPEPCHVAQQSRRDKLRVQQRRFVVSADGNPNPKNINQEELIYNCSGMLMASPSGILDFAGGGGNGHDLASCDWIVNQISAGHPLIQNHLYHLPEETTNRLSLTSFQSTLQEMVPSSPTSSLGLEMAGQIMPLVEHRQHQQQPLQIQPFKVEGGSNFSNAVASETQGLSLPSASKQQFDVGFSNCRNAAPKFLVDPRRTVGPLGPFTGYATILKSSKFLWPVQQLLDEFCSVVRNSARGSSGGHCGRSVGDDGNNYSVRGGNSGLSSSSFYTSVDQGGNSGEGRGGGGSGGGNLLVVQQPEIKQKKVKLLYLQEELSEEGYNPENYLILPHYDTSHFEDKLYSNIFQVKAFRHVRKFCWSSRCSSLAQINLAKLRNRMTM